jgi:hypothetical protein
VRLWELDELTIVTMAQDGSGTGSSRSGDAVRRRIFCERFIRLVDRFFPPIKVLHPLMRLKLLISLATHRHCGRDGRTTRMGRCLAALVLVLATADATSGVEPDPLSVVRAVIAAESAANLERAMALFADDAFIVNVTGWKTANNQELRWFINTEIWLRESFVLNHPRVEGDTVSWDEPVVGEFYKRIGVAPVQFSFEAVVKDAKIESIVAHLPTGEIARIKQACLTQAMEPQIYSRPCSEFVQLTEAHTARTKHGRNFPTQRTGKNE